MNESTNGISPKEVIALYEENRQLKSEKAVLVEALQGAENALSKVDALLEDRRFIQKYEYEKDGLGLKTGATDKTISKVSERFDADAEIVIASRSAIHTALAQVRGK